MLAHIDVLSGVKPAINLDLAYFPTQREKHQESGDLQVVTANAAICIQLINLC
jgi:hypothetical protein